MKVLLLSRYQDKTNRGVESFALELTKYLSKNHHVEIWSGRKSDNLSLVLKNRFDIVIPLNGRWQVIKMSFGRLFKNYKLLVSGHAGIGSDDLLGILVRPDVYVALTNRGYRWAKRRAFGVKIEKIPNGVDLSSYHPIGKKIDFGIRGKVVLSVGALEWYKHHEKLIRAVSKLKDVGLVIVGNGSYHDRLQKMIEELIPGRGKILSFDYQRMPEVYRSSDLFSLPSWDREAFGIVYLEAMATGLGVVAPDDDLRRELIGDAGILTDVDDPQKYAKSIKLALEKDWTEISRRQAKKYDWKYVGNEYQKLMLGLLTLDQ